MVRLRAFRTSNCAPLRLSPSWIQRGFLYRFRGLASLGAIKRPRIEHIEDEKQGISAGTALRLGKTSVKPLFLLVSPPGLEPGTP